MRLKILVLALVASLVAVSAAVAKDHPGKGPKPKTGAGCKPAVTVMLAGTLAADVDPQDGDASFVLTVKNSNRHGRAYKQAVALVLEKGLDVDAAVKQTVTEDYAKLLASIGKKESDLSDELKARLGDAVKILSQVAVAAPSSAGSSKAQAEEKPEEKGVSEEEAAAGLGALFG